MKDMKNMVHDAPVLVEQAQQMAANAQSLSAAYQAQAASQTPVTPLGELPPVDRTPLQP
jgi:hypothetical protein